MQRKQKVGELMVRHPVTVGPDDTLVEAANVMSEADIGDVLVADAGQLRGILTDRDIVVRAVAQGGVPAETTVGEVYSGELTTVAPDADVSRAVGLMRSRALRRVPVVDGGTLVGIVSLGDLAVERDEESALADISAAAPNA